MSVHELPLFVVRKRYFSLLPAAALPLQICSLRGGIQRKRHARDQRPVLQRPHRETGGSAAFENAVGVGTAVDITVGVPPAGGDAERRSRRARGIRRARCRRRCSPSTAARDDERSCNGSEQDARASNGNPHDGFLLSCRGIRDAFISQARCAGICRRSPANGLRAHRSRC